MDLSLVAFFQDLNLDPALTGALGFFSGLLLGHRLTLGRDKRNEYNNLALPIRERLIAARTDNTPQPCLPSAQELDTLSFYLGLRGKKRLQRALSEYRSAYEQQTRKDSFGQLIWNDPAPALAAIDSLLAAVRLR